MPGRVLPEPERKAQVIRRHLPALGQVRDDVLEGIARFVGIELDQMVEGRRGGPDGRESSGLVRIEVGRRVSMECLIEDAARPRRLLALAASLA